MTTPEWHAAAKRLYADGVPVGEIARQLSRPRSTVAFAVDFNNSRQKCRERTRARRAHKQPRLVRAPVTKEPKAPDHPPEVVAEASRKPTLPKISLAAAPDDEPIVRKFAPRTRLGAAGADRWREIHRRMIRDGKLPEPGLLDQFHA